MRRLVAEGALVSKTEVSFGLAGVKLGLHRDDDCQRGGEGAVQSVAEEAERENGEGEGVACSLRVPAEELGEGFVVVFCGNGVQSDKAFSFFFFFLWVEFLRVMACRPRLAIVL